MNTLIHTLKMILTDPHTSYQASCFKALEVLTAYERDDPTAPDLDYVGDPLPGHDDLADCSLGDWTAREAG